MRTTALRYIVSIAVLVEIVTVSDSWSPPSAVPRRAAAAGITPPRPRISRILPSSSSDPASKSCLFSDQRDDDDVSSSTSQSSDSDKQNSSQRSSKNSQNGGGGGLLVQLNELGQSFKGKASKANVDSLAASKTRNKVFLKLKSCCYYMFYMFYRGYRGFFVILPAVFQEVYQKMEYTVDFRVLDDEDATTTSTPSAKGPLDTNPETGKLRWRTKITVSFLSALVTLSYVIGGLVRVALKFFKTIAKTSSLSGSFLAAADEVESNESRILRITSDKDSGVNGTKMGNDKTDNGYYP